MTFASLPGMPAQASLGWNFLNWGTLSVLFTFSAHEESAVIVEARHFHVTKEKKMSTRPLLIGLLLSVLLLTACVPQAAEPVETLLPVTETVPPDEPATSPMPESATETSVSPTLGPGYYPLSTRTGNADVDAIIAAVENGDLRQLQGLIRFTAIPCTRAEGLGGPPKCEVGEAEGTAHEVLPILGPEGHFMREADLAGFQGLSVVGIHAVYRLSDSAYSEEAYPAGEYAVAFIGGENQPDVVLHIRGGIVRIDYIYPPTLLDEIVQRDASELILAPMK